MCCCRENGKLAPLVFQVPTLVMKEQPVAAPGRRHRNTSTMRREADVLVAGDGV